MEELEYCRNLVAECDAIAPNHRGARSAARRAVLRGLGPGLGPVPPLADPVVAGAIPRPAAELEPPVGWQVASTSEILSGPALVSRPVLFHRPDEAAGCAVRRS